MVGDDARLWIQHQVVAEVWSTAKAVELAHAGDGDEHSPIYGVSKNRTPFVVLNNFNKYGTLAVIFGIDNRQIVSKFCACNLWDLTKHSTSLGCVHDNHL